MKTTRFEDDTTLPDRFEEVLRNGNGKPFAFDQEDMRTLHFGGQFIQSAMRISAPDALLLTYTQTMMAFMLFIPRPRHILMIGLGGGSLAKYCYRYLPDTRITVLELNRDVMALRDKFLIPADDHRFQIIHTDAIDYLPTMTEKVDVILHDGFDADELAPSLCTETFYGLCRNVLDHEGVLVSNLWRDAVDLVAVMNRLHAAFDGKLWWGNASAGFNRIVFAGKDTDEAMFYAALTEHAVQLDAHHHCAFSDLALRLQTACGKSHEDFKAIAGYDI